jgi:DNA invertase Pin-like site-specific DNA recombinase
MKRAAIYLRVSTQDQTTANQEHELRQAAERAGWQVAKVYKDHGISGAKGPRRLRQPLPSRQHRTSPPQVR